MKLLTEIVPRSTDTINHLSLFLCVGMPFLAEGSTDVVVSSELYILTGANSEDRGKAMMAHMQVSSALPQFFIVEGSRVERVTVTGVP